MAKSASIRILARAKAAAGRKGITGLAKAVKFHGPTPRKIKIRA